VKNVEHRLAEIGETLPQPKQAVANYLGCKLSGQTLYVSGRVSPTRGEVGTDLTVAEAQIAAREALLDILAIVKKEIGSLDKIEGIEKMQGFVRSAASFTEQPKVIDGASDLLVALFGAEGRHARTATGVAQLPFGAAIQLDLIMRVAREQR
jgi:enamine deaminase RidA (YjgF/YER057c/UK114 family)